jgi:polysaccharide export outer membrane protein
MQALAQGGGITLRGTDKRLKLHRRNAAGAVEAIEPDMSMTLQSDDVVYVRESLF